MTGAGGFLGSHIAHYFGAAGHAIAAVGRFNTTPAFASLYPNLWKLCGMTLPDARFIEVIKEFKPDLLVHCAGTASVGDSVLDPYGDFQRTVEVCAFTLEAVRKHVPDCRFILLSSAAVYGNPQQLPISEDAPCKPVSPYGYHKLMCESLVEEYSQLHGLNTTILRIFSAYGERLSKQVVYDLCCKFSDPSSEYLEVFGTGEETRDFIHAIDVAKAIECVYRSKSSGVFNIGSGCQMSVDHLVQLLKNIFSSTKTTHYTNSTRIGDPIRWQADIAKLHSIGFYPTIKFEIGAKKYVEWFQSKYKDFNAS
ncbi:MAG: NAD-dependent epimerase/dehydratase family protein [Desulfuromonadaceae bacterium]